MEEPFIIKNEPSFETKFVSLKFFQRTANKKSKIEI